MDSSQIEIRIQKFNKLKAIGIPPYPERYDITHTLKQSRNLEDATLDVSLAGRITAIRGTDQRLSGNVRPHLQYLSVFAWNLHR